MGNIRKYLNNQNWNIGFADLTAKRLIETQRLPHINWMKHDYRDRFFADPFILDVTNKTITVLAEEYEFKPGSKGVIVKLTIDRNSYRLINRKLLLNSGFHLSYPLIVRADGKIFILPENSESGALSVYRYSSDDDTIEPVGIIAQLPLTDATPLTWKEKTYLFSTKAPESQENLYCFIFDETSKQYVPVDNFPIVTGKANSRMGGNFFVIDGDVYRPAQDCSRGYGGALTIFKVNSIEPEYSESPMFRLNPDSWRYNLGLHTINFDAESGLTVIDSYGYLYPTMGRILMALHTLKSKILKRS